MVRLLCVFVLTLSVACSATAQQQGPPAENEYGRYREAGAERFIALTRPEYVSAEQAQLSSDALVVGIHINGDARCFPIRQLWFHHIVNDEIGGEKVAVTYCIMANTAVTYRLPDLNESALKVKGLFGGVLAMGCEYSDNRYAQIASVPVPGCATTASLAIGPAPQITSWGRWRAAHPGTKVLKPLDRFAMSYEAFDRRPRGYNANPLMNETVIRRDARLAPGAVVFGVACGQTAKAWPLERLKQLGEAHDKVGTTPITLRWDKTLDTPVLEEPADGSLLSMRAFWYAWSSFYPKTELAQ